MSFFKKSGAASQGLDDLVRVYRENNAIIRKASDYADKIGPNRRAMAAVGLGLAPFAAGLALATAGSVAAPAVVMAAGVGAAAALAYSVLSKFKEWGLNKKSEQAKRVIAQIEGLGVTRSPTPAAAAQTFFSRPFSGAAPSPDRTTPAGAAPSA